MSVVAVLEIHMLSRAAAAMNPSTRERALAPPFELRKDRLRRDARIGEQHEHVEKQVGRLVSGVVDVERVGGRGLDELVALLAHLGCDRGVAAIEQPDDVAALRPLAAAPGDHVSEALEDVGTGHRRGV